MPYQPTKEHLDHQIPDAFKSINSLMRQLKQDIGMDDRYIALIVGLWIALHQLHSEILVVQFVHDTLTMHQVVDEQESFHGWTETPVPRVIATA